MAASLSSLTWLTNKDPSGIVTLVTSPQLKQGPVGVA